MLVGVRITSLKFTGFVIQAEMTLIVLIMTKNGMFGYQRHLLITKTSVEYPIMMPMFPVWLHRVQEPKNASVENLGQSYQFIKIKHWN